MTKPKKPPQKPTTRPHTKTRKAQDDPFTRLGLSATDRERLAELGRLAKLANKESGAATFIRIRGDSTTFGDCDDAELG